MKERRVEVWNKLAGNQEGFLLVAALTLMTVLILVGGTAMLLSSTDLKIASNFRTNESVLQVAMGGAERAREVLTAANFASTDKTSFTDELVNYVGANAVLNGYTSGSDDPLIASGTLNGVTYSVYITNDPQDTNQFSTTDTNQRVLLTSVATGPQSSIAIVQSIVKINSMPVVPGAVYSKDNISLNGSSLTVNGNDASGCGGTNQPPTYTLSPSNTCYPGTTNPACGQINGGQSPTLNGSPSTPVSGSTDIDITSMVDQLQKLATNTLTANQQNATFGSSSDYKIVYADATALGASTLTLNNVTGYGILVVKGNLNVAGNFNWNGPIIVTGVAQTSGGGNQPKNINGQLITGQSALGDTDLNGAITINYNSCMMRNSLAARLPVVSWKQVY